MKRFYPGLFKIKLQAKFINQFKAHKFDLQF